MAAPSGHSEPEPVAGDGEFDFAEAGGGDDAPGVPQAQAASGGGSASRAGSPPQGAGIAGATLGEGTDEGAGAAADFSFSEEDFPASASPGAGAGGAALAETDHARTDGTAAGKAGESGGRGGMSLADGPEEAPDQSPPLPGPQEGSPVSLSAMLPPPDDWVFGSAAVSGEAAEAVRRRIETVARQAGLIGPAGSPTDVGDAPAAADFAEFGEPSTGGAAGLSSRSLHPWPGQGGGAGRGGAERAADRGGSDSQRSGSQRSGPSPSTGASGSPAAVLPAGAIAGHAAGKKAKRRTGVAEAGRLVCAFWLEGECYGLDVAAVGRVVVVEGIRRVPLTPPAVLGVCNLRGQVLTVVDIATVLGLEPRPWQPTGWDAGGSAVTAGTGKDAGSVAVAAGTGVSTVHRSAVRAAGESVVVINHGGLNIGARIRRPEAVFPITPETWRPPPRAGEHVAVRGLLVPTGRKGLAVTVLDADLLAGKLRDLRPTGA